VKKKILKDRKKENRKFRARIFWVSTKQDNRR